jgi:hypothetical protein
VWCLSVGKCHLDVTMRKDFGKCNCDLVVAKCNRKLSLLTLLELFTELNLCCALCLECPQSPSVRGFDPGGVTGKWGSFWEAGPSGRSSNHLTVPLKRSVGPWPFRYHSCSWAKKPAALLHMGVTLLWGQLIMGSKP